MISKQHVSQGMTNKTRRPSIMVHTDSDDFNICCRGHCTKWPLSALVNRFVQMSLSLRNWGFWNFSAHFKYPLIWLLPVNSCSTIVWIYRSRDYGFDTIMGHFLFIFIFFCMLHILRRIWSCIALNYLIFS